MAAHKFVPVKRRQAAPPVFLPPTRKAKQTRTVTFADTCDVILIDQRRSIEDDFAGANEEQPEARKNPFEEQGTSDRGVFDAKLGVKAKTPSIRLTRELFFRACGAELVESLDEEIVSQCSGGVWDSCDTPLSDHSLSIPYQDPVPTIEDLAGDTINQDHLRGILTASDLRDSDGSTNWSTFLVTSFTDSQLSLMEYLRSRQWLAYSMQEFCNVYQVSFCAESLAPWELEKIIKQLSIYVVSPVTMPSSFKFRALAEEFEKDLPESEIFKKLTQLWQAVPGNQAATSFGSEIDSGFWIGLCKLVGVRLVAYFLQNCRIYRPFKDTMGSYTPGKWVHLGLGRRWTMYYSWDIIGQKMRRRREIDTPTYGLISKRTILYRCSSAARREFQLISKPTFETDSEVGQLLLIVHKRLQKYASLSSRAQNGRFMVKSRTNNEKKNLQNPIKQCHWTPTNTVASCITAILRRLLPTRLLGSVANHRAFYRAIGKYIKTPAHSQCTIASFAKDIKLREVPWARELHLEKQQGEFMRALGWMLPNVINPLLAYHFYLTEMSGKPTTLYYFEHQVWEEIYQKQGRDFLVSQFQTDGNAVIPFAENLSADDSVNHSTHLNKIINMNGNDHERLTKTSVSASANTNSSESEYVRTRYVPKPDGSIRPILNLKSINHHLQAAHHVLHQLILAEYPRLNRPQDWIAQLYAYRSTFEPNTVFYTVKADLKGCYDNANVASVAEFVAKLVNRQPSSLYRVETIRAFNIQKDIVRDRKVVSALPERIGETLVAVASDPKLLNNYGVIEHTEIVSELPNPEVISNAEILHQVHNLLNELPLRISRDELIKFRKGIPQGSSLSLELCNVLLEELISDRLAKFANHQRSLLLRYVDDFLFVTTHKPTAIEFEKTMRSGFVEKYGLFCSPGKVVAVLDPQTAASDAESSPAVLNYLGREIDVRTLDVRPVDLPPLNMSLNCSTKKIRELRKRLHLDIQKLMEPIRTFQRCNQPVPPPLLRSTVVTFGKLMAHRIPYYILARAESRSGRRIRQIETHKDPRQQPVSSKAVMYCLLSRYFTEFVPKAEFSEKLYRPAITRYYQESKRLGSSFLDLAWRPRKTGALLRDLMRPPNVIEAEKKNN